MQRETESPQITVQVALNKKHNFIVLTLSVHVQPSAHCCLFKWVAEVPTKNVVM